MLTGAIAGLTSGGIYAVLAVCLTVMARLVRVVNFAQVILGGLSVYCASVLVSDGVPYLLGVGLGLVVTVGLSCLLGWIMTRWLPEAGADRRSAVSIGALVGLVSLSYVLFGSHPRRFSNITPGTAFSLAGSDVSVATVVVLGIAVLSTLAAHLVLNRTAVGLRLRALSERPTTAELVGVRPAPLTIAVWTITGLIAGIVIAISAPILANDQGALSLVVVPGLAAALIGSFRRLDLALAGGIGLGVLQGLLAQLSTVRQYRDVIPFALILMVLLWSQRREVWDAAR